MDYSAKFTAIQFNQQYGRAEAIKILEKLAELSEQEAVAIKIKAAKYQAAANVLRLTDKPEELGE